MPTKAPSQPIIACQPWRTAASTPTSGALAEHRGAVGRVLRREELEGRAETTAAAMPLAGEEVGGGERERDLGAGGDDRHVRGAVGLAQDVGAAGGRFASLCVARRVGRFWRDRQSTSACVVALSAISQPRRSRPRRRGGRR